MSVETSTTSSVSAKHAQKARGFWSDFTQLTKARLTLLVLLTTLAGFYLGSVGPVDYGLLFHTLFGTILIASSSAALNQYIERRADGKMRRTQNRPLVTERMPADEVVVLAISAAVVGGMYLALMVNLSAAVLAIATLLLYLLVYTPLKMESELFPPMT